MRILLADHHQQVLRTLRQLISEKTEYTLVGDASNVDGLLEALRQNFNITYERVADNQVVLGSAQEGAEED